MLSRVTSSSGGRSFSMELKGLRLSSKTALPCFYFSISRYVLISVFGIVTSVFKLGFLSMSSKSSSIAGKPFWALVEVKSKAEGAEFIPTVTMPLYFCEILSIFSTLSAPLGRAGKEPLFIAVRAPLLVFKIRPLCSVIF